MLVSFFALAACQARREIIVSHVAALHRGASAQSNAIRAHQVA
jgi:hypothetical protein